MKSDLKKRAGARLRMLIEDYRLMSQQALKEELSVSDRAIRNWYQSMPLDRARDVAAKLGLDESFFEVDDTVLVERDLKSFFGTRGQSEPCKKQVSFDGTTTLSLIRFIDANQEALKTANVHIDTFGANGGTYKFSASLISSGLDGYVRTLIHQGNLAPEFIGGVNAVVEDHRLARIIFKNLSDDLILGTGSGFRALSDEETVKEGVALPAGLMRWKMPADAIYYASRIPNAASFAILISALEENWTDFTLCELVFDALKKFWVHMRLYRSDRLRAEQLIFKFLKVHSGVDEAKDALTFAIEALPFCSQSDRDARNRTIRLIDDIQHQRRYFAKLPWEAQFAARVAYDFLPFVTNPDKFEVA